MAICGALCHVLLELPYESAPFLICLLEFEVEHLARFFG
jgi:hypothetical protein